MPPTCRKVVKNAKGTRKSEKSLQIIYFNLHANCRFLNLYRLRFYGILLTAIRNWSWSKWPLSRHWFPLEMSLAYLRLSVTVASLSWLSSLVLSSWGWKFRKKFFLFTVYFFKKCLLISTFFQLAYESIRHVRVGVDASIDTVHRRAILAQKLCKGIFNQGNLESCPNCTQTSVQFSFSFKICQNNINLLP